MKHSLISLGLILTAMLICITTYSQNVEQFTKFELDIDPSTLSSSDEALVNSKNPFRKEEIILRATFQPPNSNSISINGFFYEEYNLIDDPSNNHPAWPHLAHQNVTSTGTTNWKVRFTPEITGNYTYNIEFYLPVENRTISITSGQFSCISNTETKDGFIRLINDNFKYSDGTGFIPIGVNIYHYPYWNAFQPKVNFYELYFDELSKNGCNLVRITCDFRGALSLTTVKGCTYFLDEYSMPDAFVLDEIIALAESYKIKIHLRLFGHENFTETNAWEHWNTYNINSQMPGCSVNPNGVCNTKDEFFTSSIAKGGF